MWLLLPIKVRRLKRRLRCSSQARSCWAGPPRVLLLLAGASAPCCLASARRRLLHARPPGPGPRARRNLHRPPQRGVESAAGPSLLPGQARAGNLDPPGTPRRSARVRFQQRAGAMDESRGARLRHGPDPRPGRPPGAGEGRGSESRRGAFPGCASSCTARAGSRVVGWKGVEIKAVDTESESLNSKVSWLSLATRRRRDSMR